MNIRFAPSTGSPDDAAALDGSKLAHIHLPERCGNLCFGGDKRNRLFMAGTHSFTRSMWTSAGLRRHRARCATLAP